MPLLRKKTLERTNDVLELLKDDDEVFYCEVTNELFRNYEEYCERIILVNSMVWSCSMTGKSNLTYAEALKSEEDAASSLKLFPAELRVPIIYLASQTKQKVLKDMLEDVFQYAKDKYFIGEKVQVFLNDEWIDAQVTLVRESPKKAKETSKNNTTSDYIYELKLLPFHQSSKTLTMKSHQIQRKKGSYSRPKNKLFIKQYVEQSDGIFRIKPAILKKFNIEKYKFSDIFVGDAPNFAVKQKSPEASLKANKQESIAKYFTKTDGSPKLNQTVNGDVKSLKNKPFASKKSSDELRQKILNDKKSLQERRQMEKISAKDTEARLQKFIKQWHMSKEDLELTDQRVLPVPNTIDTFISNKKFGEFVAILEFLETFSEELNLRESFPHGVTWDILERALTLKEINGPLHDIFQLLLFYIFKLISNEYRANNGYSKPNLTRYVFEQGTLASHVQHATIALRFSNSQFNSLLVNKQVDAVTLSEVLRLHLLSSGSRVRENLTKYRYNQRGGYDSTDDPGLQLRISQPHILKALSMYNVCQLPQNDILKLLTCLMNQILTYNPIRELVEKRIEASSKAKLDFRILQAAHRKTIAEYTTNKQKCTKDLETEQSRDNQRALDTLEKEHTRYLQTYTEQCNGLLRIQFSHEIYLGSDRCHRRYWLFESLPGLFVEDNEAHPGSCLANIVQQHRELGTCDTPTYMKHLRNMFKEQRQVHDKENTDVSEIVIKNESNTPDRTALQNKASELQMCTSDEKTCRIHGNCERTRWSFFYTKDEIDALLTSLNKRGIRERVLLNNLKQWKELIYDHVEGCPVERLNKTMTGNMSLRPKMKYHENDTNLNHAPGTDASVILRNTLVEFILELYEKIESGLLGKLAVEDVEAWQEALRAGQYDMQCDEIAWDVRANKKTVKKRSGEILTVFINPADEKDKKTDAKGGAAGAEEGSGGDEEDEDSDCDYVEGASEYYDPGSSLGATLDIESEDSEEEEICALHESAEQKENLGSLASALLQVAQSVEPANLQVPFGRYNPQTNLYSENSPERYRKWEISLMNSTSYAQIFSHYHAFEQSIIWANSIQNASCRVCKRKFHAQQMLLCDKCNCAIHMYCVKPEIKQIPEGDWYCDTCKPTDREKRNRRNRRAARPINYDEEEPVKKRRKANDYDSMTNGDDSGLDVSKDFTNGVHDEKPTRTKSNKRSSVDTFTVCSACKSGGVMITCDTCQMSWHVECVVPAIRRAPRGRWSCTKCSKNSRRQDSMPSHQHISRRCASLCRKRITGYAQLLNREPITDDDDESSDESTSVRKSRRTNDSMPGPDFAFGIATGQELDTLLGEVAKHKDSWPFMSPVTVEEVPDYFDIIKHPMDFGTIRSKLKYGEYKDDMEPAADIALVFENCDTYNNGESDVYKAGARLLKFVLKRGEQLNIEFPESIKGGFLE